MSIRKEDIVEWSTFRGKLGSKLRVGFMSQISPDGRHVMTSVNDPGIDQTDYERRKDPQDLVRNYYVANFLDYRFLQVFYPTRGVLAWYSKKSGHLKYLPGAADPRFMQANAVWSPCGKYLVFARDPKEIVGAPLDDEPAPDRSNVSTMPRRSLAAASASPARGRRSILLPARLLGPPTSALPRRARFSPRPSSSLPGPPSLRLRVGQPPWIAGATTVEPIASCPE